MYRVDITNSPDSVFRIKSKDYEFSVDTKGQGVTPPDTLLASLGACVGVYVRKYAEGAKLEIRDFSISVEAEFTKEPPVRFGNISVCVDLKGIALDERRQEALLAFIKNCPVHNTLKNDPQIEVKLI